MPDRKRLEQALIAADAAGDTAAAQQIAQAIRALPKGRQPFEAERNLYSQAIEQRSFAPLIEGARESLLSSPESGALYGMAKPFIGAAQLGMKAGEAVFGETEGREPLSQQVAGGLERYEQARRQAGGSSVPVLGGQVATGAGLTSRIAPAAGFVRRALQGSAIGAGMGAVEPVTSTDGSFASEKGAQVGVGAAAGGGMSLLGSLVTTLARRILPGGAQVEAGRVANELAGPRQPEVVAALGGRPERVRGAWPQDSRAIRTGGADVGPRNLAQPTAGQAAAPAGSAEFSALQRRAAQVRPSEYQDIAQAQAGQRLGALSEIAGTPDDIARARVARAAATRPLYEAAELSDAPVDVRRTLRLIDGISQRRANESAFRVLDDVKQTLVRPFFRDGGPMIPEERVPQLISASRNISQLLDAKDATGRPVNAAISRELATIKRSLDRQIAKAAPEFGEAQRLFADLSKPIDRMKVGQYIQDRLVPAINDAGADIPQRATVFANAMRTMNDNVKAATGFKRGGGLADLMTPEEMATLNNIGKGLARDVDVQRLAQAGGKRATQALGDMFSEQAPNALSRPLMIINAILRRTGGGASERTMTALADAMQDPRAMAEIMEKATDAERRAIERGIMLYMTGGAVSTPDDAMGWAQRTVERGINQMSEGNAQ